MGIGALFKNGEEARSAYRSKPASVVSLGTRGGKRTQKEEVQAIACTYRYTTCSRHVMIIALLYIVAL